MQKKAGGSRRIFSIKDRNRFTRLRYASENSTLPTMSETELSKKIGCSKSYITKIESYSTDEQMEGISARYYKKYHDVFHCSYEYLFGDVESPLEKYSSVTSNSPIFRLDAKSISNLEKLLDDEYYGERNIHMMEAILADPVELQKILNNIFESMYYIDASTHDETMDKTDKTNQKASLWYSIISSIDAFLKNELSQHLRVAFDRYNAKRKEHEEEEIAQMENDLNELESHINHSKIVATVICPDTTNK